MGKTVTGRLHPRLAIYSESPPRPPQRWPGSGPRSSPLLLCFLREKEYVLWGSRPVNGRCSPTSPVKWHPRCPESPGPSAAGAAATQWDIRRNTPALINHNGFKRFRNDNREPLPEHDNRKAPLHFRVTGLFTFGRTTRLPILWPRRHQTRPRVPVERPCGK